MNLASCRSSRSAALAVATAVVFTMPLNASGAANTQQHRAEAPNADDEGMLFPGDPVVLTDHSGRANIKAWMQFRTDPCGTLLRVESRHTLVIQTAFDDDMDDMDDDDPADLGREMIGQWLSEHSEIAVVNDGVDKECDQGWFDEEELPGDFEARFMLRGRGASMLGDSQFA